MNTVFYATKDFHFPGRASDLLRGLKDEPYCFLLESSFFDEQRGRYSYLGFDPFYVAALEGKDALKRVREEYQKYRHTPSGVPGALGAGIVGFIGYDFGLTQERVCLREREKTGLPDTVFGFYDTVIMIDHLEKKLFILSSGLPETGEKARKQRREERLEYFAEKIQAFIPESGEEPSAPITWDLPLPGKDFTSNFTHEQYLEAVAKALDYIRGGDIYQVNVSQRFRMPLAGRDPADIYRRLRAFSPAPFSSYMDCRDFQIVSSSPERFLKLSGNTVQTRPMKGTRPRCRDEQQDRLMYQEMRASAKDKAELLMITDLERNDLGRVCAYGSVRVEEMRAIEIYQTVYQTTSTVAGTLREGKDTFDLLSACFPGGSITGCPKIRSMEIIEELEPDRRGIYTGCMGYVSFSGDMDFNILIRTLLCREGRIDFHVGGGIVADSDPAKEYEETLVKARAMFQALEV